MQAELKYLFSPSGNLDDFQPENASFCIFVQAMIGPKNGEGEESFDFYVCSPEWISEEVTKARFIFGRGYLIVPEYNFERMREHLSRLCERISGKDWEEIANKLSRFGIWEFEDYEDRSSNN